MRVGLHTGMVIAQPFGTQRRQGISAVAGHTPLVAAQLQEAASEGEILVSDALVPLLHDQYDLESVCKIETGAGQTAEGGTVPQPGQTATASSPLVQLTREGDNLIIFSLTGQMDVDQISHEQTIRVDYAPQPVKRTPLPTP